MAISRICLIATCDKKAFARGWCSAHYERWRRHGDPLGGGTGDGEPVGLLNDVVLPYEGDDCLTWPFVRNPRGYGLIRRDNTMKLVSRLVCEHANGPPPTPKHEAAHSCGKGHEGCVAKRHLSWKTSAENKADMIAHGTRNYGCANGSVKLSDADVLAIRASKGASSQRDLAERFGVSQATVSLIHTGKRWAHLS
jgi:hypothetical protein